jgi:hypothetical protein
MRPSRLILILCMTLPALAAHAAPLVRATGPAGPVASGATFQLQLDGSGFDQTDGGQVIDNVTGGQAFALQFDASRLAIESVQIDPHWNFATANRTGTIDNVAGTLTGLAFAAFPATTDDGFPIATVTFRALAGGSAQVAVTGGEIAARVAGVSGSRIVPGFQPASVTLIAAAAPARQVPMPTWSLLALGAALASMQWRRGRRATRAS